MFVDFKNWGFSHLGSISVRDHDLLLFEILGIGFR